MDGPDAQPYRTRQPRTTRAYPQQPAYADDDDPNAPSRYRRYVPVAPQVMRYGYGRADQGQPYWGPDDDR